MSPRARRLSWFGGLYLAAVATLGWLCLGWPDERPPGPGLDVSGQLALVMEQIAPYYKEKMEGLVTKVSKMLEPLIIVFMGSTIAGLMLAIYMPMFEMAGKVN